MMMSVRSQELQFLFRVFNITPKSIAEKAREAKIPGVTESKIRSVIDQQAQPIAKIDRYILGIVSMIVNVPPNLLGPVTMKEVERFLPPMTGTYDQLMNEGRQSAKAGLYLKAMRFFHSAERKAGNDNHKSLANYNLSQCLLSIGSYNMAAEAAVEALEYITDPAKHWKVTYLLVRILVNQKSRLGLARSLAIGLYHQCEDDVQCADISAIMAQLEYNAGDYDEAIENIKAAITQYAASGDTMKESYSKVTLGYYEFLKTGKTGMLGRMEEAHSDLKKTNPEPIDLVKSKNLILRVLMQKDPADAGKEIQKLLTTCEQWDFYDAYFFGKATLYYGAGERKDRERHLRDIKNIWPNLTSWNPDLERFSELLLNKEWEGKT